MNSMIRVMALVVGLLAAGTVSGSEPSAAVDGTTLLSTGVYSDRGLSLIEVSYEPRACIAEVSQSRIAVTAKQMVSTPAHRPSFRHGSFSDILMHVVRDKGPAGLYYLQVADSAGAATWPIRTHRFRGVHLIRDGSLLVRQVLPYCDISQLMAHLTPALEAETRRRRSAWVSLVTTFLGSRGFPPEVAPPHEYLRQARNCVRRRRCGEWLDIATRYANASWVELESGQ